MSIEEEMMILFNLELALSENEIDNSLYSTCIREENRICFFKEGSEWCSASIVENKEHNLKKYSNFEDGCIDFISILSKVSGKNKEEEKKVLLSFKEKLNEKQKKRY